MRLLPIYCLFLLLFACDFSGNDGSEPISSSQLTDLLVSSSGLRVELFLEDGVDETSDYSDFLFEFDRDGSVTARRSNQVFTGSYRVFRDDGRTELAMVFSPTSPLQEFTDDWYFVSKTSNRITFEDDDDFDDLDRLVFRF